jgi:hypothetical protein
MVAIRIAALCAVIAILAWGVYGERHDVRSFADDQVRIVPGGSLAEGSGQPWWPASMCEAAATDAFVRRDDGLYHLATLAPGRASLKDCAT